MPYKNPADKAAWRRGEVNRAYQKQFAARMKRAHEAIWDATRVMQFCVVCQRDLNGRGLHTSRKTCSAECAQKNAIDAKRRGRKNYARKPRRKWQARPCLVCAEIIPPSRTMHAVTCSEKCSRRRHNNRPRTEQKIAQRKRYLIRQQAIIEAARSLGLI